MPIAIDLFSGCGGLTQGLKQAGFKVSLAVEYDEATVSTYKENHPETRVINKDIREVTSNEIISSLKGAKVDLIAGCPPCQGFSNIKTLNGKNKLIDERNELINDYVRIVEALTPPLIMMENVPGIVEYELFNNAVDKFKKLGYNITYQIVNIADYGVPQRRKRLVLLGSRLGTIQFPAGLDGPPVTVRDCIYNLPTVEESEDPIHKIHSNHGEKVKHIITLIPKDGGNRKDLPEEYWLDCHKKKGIGFTDVYGRLSWDKVSSTITGGCLNPSKGRFLHPVFNRSITAREAALLQTFPPDYKFLGYKSKSGIAQMIGNSFPPKFSEIQATYLLSHLKLKAPQTTGNINS